MGHRADQTIPVGQLRQAGEQFADPHTRHRRGDRLIRPTDLQRCHRFWVPAIEMAGTAVLEDKDAGLLPAVAPRAAARRPEAIPVDPNPACQCRRLAAVDAGRGRRRIADPRTPEQMALASSLFCRVARTIARSTAISEPQLRLRAERRIGGCGARRSDSSPRAMVAHRRLRIFSLVGVGASPTVWRVKV